MAQLIKVVMEYRIDDGVDPTQTIWGQTPQDTWDQNGDGIQAVKLLSLEVTGTCPDSIF